jgi:spore germination protein
MQSSEDYFERGILTSSICFIRYLFFGMELLLPSLYIAALTFHQGMVPRNLLFAIWASRENVPFPVFIEALIMEIFFEGLREAGLRLSNIAGQNVSIVGALVIGQAAVQANIVSASMVIVVSITGISSFIIPRYSLALSIRLLRFMMMILAGTLGLYGMFMGGLWLLDLDLLMAKILNV